MIDIIEEMGLDPENITWRDIGSCKDMEINWFYDTYENDQIHAANADLICARCPVVKQCLEAGMSNKEEGLWGGVYLSSGRVDKTRNKHKTDDDWKRLEARVDKKLH